MREEFVKKVLAHEKTKSALCREYGISRPTGDKWIKRYIDGNMLEDRSRAPMRTPKKVSIEVEQEIVRYRNRYPALGGTKIRRLMENEGKQGLPSARTYTNIFHRNKLIDEKASEAATHYQRYEKSEPNEMWQMDYKGHFGMKDGTRCHPLNIVDDHSRYNICIEAMRGETLEELKPVLTRVMKEYGMPEILLCDNGNPWGSGRRSGFTVFEVWMMEIGVLVIHGKPMHPQTQGKTERFNQTFTRECLRKNEIEDMVQGQKCFDEYRKFYNNVRPHMALNMEVPASIYHKSPRSLPDRIESWEYGSEYTVRKVSSKGYIRYRNHDYFLSEGFAGKQVGIRESHIEKHVTLEYREFKIARIDVEQQMFTVKRIYRKENDPRT